MADWIVNPADEEGRRTRPNEVDINSKYQVRNSNGDTSVEVGRLANWRNITHYRLKESE